MSETEYVDWLGRTPRSLWPIMDPSACPQKAKHTKCPEGYMQWSLWAEEKIKTHRTERCRGCGLFVIWVKKKRRGAAK